MKKAIVMFCAAMVAMVWSVTALAEYWNEGNDGDSWGTAYVIDSVGDMMLMNERTGVHTYARTPETGKYYKLVTDIDLPEDWDPKNFVGYFDGQYHNIKVNVNRADDENMHSFALFSVLSGDSIIKNLNVEGNIKTTAYSAGLVLELESGTIENCSFTGNIELIENDMYAIIAAGGLVWTVGDYKTSLPALVKNCSFKGTITASGRSASAGGIANGMYGGRIENCTVLSGSKISVNIDSDSSDRSGFAGGISAYVGYGESAYGSNNMSYGVCYITGCTSYAEVECNSGYIGGIAGVSTMYWPNMPEAEAYFSGNQWPEIYPKVGNAPSSSTTPTTPDNPASTDQPATSSLPTGTIQPITLSQDTLQKIASTLSADISQLLILSSDNITAPQEPTMNYMASSKIRKSAITSSTASATPNLRSAHHSSADFSALGKFSP